MLNNNQKQWILSLLDLPLQEFWQKVSEANPIENAKLKSYEEVMIDQERELAEAQEKMKEPEGLREQLK